MWFNNKVSRRDKFGSTLICFVWFSTCFIGAKLISCRYYVKLLYITVCKVKVSF